MTQVFVAPQAEPNPTETPTPTASVADRAATGDHCLPNTWHVVCLAREIPVGQGVAAMIAGKQIALFRTDAGQMFALGNHDPFTGANVLSRGILGSRGTEDIVISPMLKHAFSLANGQSFDDPEICVPSYPVRIRSGRVEVLVGQW